MKRENSNQYNNTTSSPLKVHKFSHAIKRSSYSTSTKFVPSLVVAGSRPNHHHQRGPVIIYTHSPKVIHTNPRDFMSLVQKLTGMSRSKDDNVGPTKKITTKPSANDHDSSTTIDDNESSSVITDENCSSGGDVVGHLNHPCMENAPFFGPSPALPQGPLVPGFPFFVNGNESDFGQSCNSGDSPLYDYMSNGFPYYNPIT